jgi:nucleotide-binding universal stress UspA family protein
VRAVVAYRGETDGDGALLLAGALRRTTGAELSVVAVLPRVSVAGEDRSDQEYRAYLDGVAAQARADAAALLTDGDLDALDFERVSSTSVAAGLVDAVLDRGADVLVLGCARDATHGNLVVGSVADRLLHSSPVPLMMAPHRYATQAGARFGALTAAYAGTERSKQALGAACDLAKRFGLRLRVATFVPRANTMYPPEVGIDAEDMVAAQFAEQAVGLHQEALAFCAERGVEGVTAVVGRGKGWAGALAGVEWSDDDVLVFGSSRLGHLARVFLGSTATKILRYSPVPVLVVPSGTAGWVES